MEPAKAIRGIRSRSTNDFQNRARTDESIDISFDSLFTSSGDQDVDIQEMIGLYQACPEQGRRLILASTRAMAHELIDVK